MFTYKELWLAMFEQLFADNPEAVESIKKQMQDWQW